jgi:hypothetical protein
MGSNGIVGFGVSNPTFLDRAYEQKQIDSANFILMLRQDDEQSAMLYNRLPADILSRNMYVPVSNSKLCWSIQEQHFSSLTINFSQT